MAVVNKNSTVPNLDRVLFWDFDIDAMDFEKAYKTIIARIVSRAWRKRRNRRNCSFLRP
jgi:hypothetical protein